MKRIALVVISTGMLMANTSNIEKVLEETFKGKFSCEKNICISENTVISEENGEFSVKNTLISFTKIPSLIKTNIAEENCKKIDVTIPMEECLIEENKKVDQERMNTVMNSIKEIKMKDISVLNKEKGETINIESANLNKTGYFSINKEDLKSLTLADIIVDANVDIKGLTIETDGSKERMTEFTEGLFKNKTEENEKFKKMYSILMTEFLKENKISKDIHFGLKSEVVGSDLSVNLELTSDSKEMGSLKGNILFKIENIKRNLEMFNLMNQDETQAGFGGLMALSQGVILEEINIDFIATKLRLIHTNLINTNKEYEENYNSIILGLKKDQNKIDTFYTKVLTLQNNTSSIKINNNQKLKLMMLFMSLANPNIDKMIDIETKYN